MKSNNVRTDMFSSSFSLTDIAYLPTGSEFMLFFKEFFQSRTSFPLCGTSRGQ